nr:DUF2062 domain-containing protein [Granulicella arctica]
MALRVADRIHRPELNRSLASPIQRAYRAAFPTVVAYSIFLDVNSTIHHGWLYRRLILPILALLRMGATPEKLAWSIAVGAVIGINPMLGTTTLLCLAIAFVFRLNIAASQLANHILYPFELLLVIPFIRLGSFIFHTDPMPLSPASLMHAARTEPIALTRRLWLWEWHALVTWAVLAIVITPLLALVLTPLLRHLLIRIQGHQYPILPTIKHHGSTTAH